MDRPLQFREDSQAYPSRFTPGFNQHKTAPAKPVAGGCCGCVPIWWRVHAAFNLAEITSAYRLTRAVPLGVERDPVWRLDPDRRWVRYPDRRLRQWFLPSPRL